MTSPSWFFKLVRRVDAAFANCVLASRTSAAFFAASASECEARSLATPSRLHASAMSLYAKAPNNPGRYFAAHCSDDHRHRTSHLSPAGNTASRSCRHSLKSENAPTKLSVQVCRRNVSEITHAHRGTTAHPPFSRHV